MASRPPSSGRAHKLFSCLFEVLFSRLSEGTILYHIQLYYISYNYIIIYYSIKQQQPGCSSAAEGALQRSEKTHGTPRGTSTDLTSSWNPAPDSDFWVKHLNVSSTSPSNGQRLRRRAPRSKSPPLRESFVAGARDGLEGRGVVHAGVPPRRAGRRSAREREREKHDQSSKLNRERKMKTRKPKKQTRQDGGSGGFSEAQQQVSVSRRHGKEHCLRRECAA